MSSKHVRRWAILAASICIYDASAAVTRNDFCVITADRVRIFVREVKASGISQDNTEPLILLHGARVPGLASFDLQVAGGSLAADLAEQTRRAVYIMDARNYGQSKRQSAMDQPAEQNQPLSRAYEVVRDIDAVVHEAERRSHTSTVALFGWATGGMWAGYYASLHPEEVRHLILLNSLYGGSSQHALIGPGSSSSDPQHSDRVNPKLGGYAFTVAPSLFRAWDQSIPIANKDAWRDPKIAKAYEDGAMASDPTSSTRTPRSFRAPMGAQEDSFYQAIGRKLFDAEAITGHILLLRSEYDFWSRPEDAQAFAHDAEHARSLRVVELKGATHHVHLDKSEHGRSVLLQEIVEFLRADSAKSQ